MKRFPILLGALILAACGTSAQVQTVQNNKTVQQIEAKVETQVSKCLPTANGAPDPLLMRRSAEQDKFVQCTGVAKNANVFKACAFKVIFGGIPTVAGLQKGLTACVEKAA